MSAVYPNAPCTRLPSIRRVGTPVAPERSCWIATEIARRALVGDYRSDAPGVQAERWLRLAVSRPIVEVYGVLYGAGLVLSPETYGKMVQNLFWATGYNVVALPLAAGVLAGAGLLLPRAIGVSVDAPRRHSDYSLTVVWLRARNWPRTITSALPPRSPRSVCRTLSVQVSGD